MKSHLSLVVTMLMMTTVILLPNFVSYSAAIDPVMAAESSTKSPSGSTPFVYSPHLHWNDARWSRGVAGGSENQGHLIGKQNFGPALQDDILLNADTSGSIQVFAAGKSSFDPHINPEQVLLVGTLDGKLHGVSALTGKPKWTLECLKGTTLSSDMTSSSSQTMDDSNAMDSDDEQDQDQEEQVKEHIFLPGMDGSVYFFNTDSGLQKLPLSASELVDASPYTAEDGTVFVGSKQTKLLAVDPLTGELYSSFLTGSDNGNQQCKGIPKNALLVAMITFDVIVIDGETGLQKWNVSFSEFRTSVRGGSSDVDAKVFDDLRSKTPALQTNMDGMLYSVSPESGKLFWNTSLASPVTSIFAFSESVRQANRRNLVYDLKRFHPMKYADKNLHPSLVSPTAYVSREGKEVFVVEQPIMVKEKMADVAARRLQLQLDGKPAHAPLYPSDSVIKSTDVLVGDNEENDPVDVDSTALVSTAQGNELAVQLPKGRRQCTRNSPDFPDCLLGMHHFEIEKDDTMCAEEDKDGIAALPSGSDNKSSNNKDDGNNDGKHQTDPNDSGIDELDDDEAINTDDDGEGLDDDEDDHMDDPDDDADLDNDTDEDEPIIHDGGSIPHVYSSEEFWVDLEYIVLYVLIMVLVGLFYWYYRKTQQHLLQVQQQVASANDSKSKPDDKSDNKNNQELKPEQNNNSDSPPGHLRVGSLNMTDRVLGFGSAGTIVYEGYIDLRRVAVKRMLRAFYDIADKEIALLLELDEHPNIIRYFVKEENDEFVFLALELCSHTLSNVVEHGAHIHGRIEELPDKYDSDSSSSGSSRGNKPTGLVANLMDNQKPGKGNGKSKGKGKGKSKGKGKRKNKGDDSLSSSSSSSGVEIFRDSSNTLTRVVIRLPKYTEQILFEIMSGLEHLHKLNIVHRDLKPQNVLVTPTARVKISDMGLAKKLDIDKSSFETKADPAGTMGWQAPEMLRGERMTRAVDIFSAGCIFYYVITGGHHPFGDRYEREMNVMKGNADLSELDHFPEAQDLISKMIHNNSEMRPTASQVLQHLLFWDPDKQLTFLNEASDRLEVEQPDTPIVQAFEAKIESVFTGSWLDELDPLLIENLGNYRKYNGTMGRDLLRVIRNKKNHFRDMSAELQEIMGPLPDGYLKYWKIRFPKLLTVTYNFLSEWSKQEDWFSKYI